MFIVKSNSDYCVRFESNVTWLELWYDKYSLYIGIGIKKSGYKLSLFDIVRFSAGNAVNVSYAASTKENLYSGLKILSNCLQSYAHKALIGDKVFYDEVLKFSRNCSIEKSLESKLNHIENLAKVSWERREYDEVIKLYGSIYEHLTELQRKRLNFCQRSIEI
jgi:hypothetical protein